MKRKIRISILILIATVDFVFAYKQDGRFELYNLGAMYLACGIGLRALSENKNQGAK